MFAAGWPLPCKPAASFPVKPRLLIALAFLLWSTTGIFVRKSGLSVPNFIFAANVMGIAVLFFISPRRLSDFRKLPLKPLLGMSIMGAVNVWASFEAFHHTSLGNVMIPHYVAPVLVALLAPLTLKERPSARTWEALVLSILGLCAVAYEEIGISAAEDLYGIALGTLSGIAYAVVILCGREVARAGADSVTVTLFQSAVLPLVVLPFITVGEYTSQGLLLSFVAGLLHLVFAAVIYLQGLRKTSASTTATIGYLEILFAMMWGALFYSELISWSKIAGALLIVTGGIIAIRAEEKVIKEISGTVDM